MTEEPKKRGNPNIIEAGKATRWKPNQSGNPAGRPPMGQCITDQIRTLLDKQAGTGKTNVELIAQAIVELSKDPNKRGFVPAIKELLDRIEGRVPETHKFESDAPINITFKLVKGDKDE